MTEIAMKLDAVLPTIGPSGDMNYTLVDRTKQIEALKESMKQKLSVQIDGTSHEDVYNRVNTELSMSLPNLTDPASVVLLEEAGGDVRARSSLSCIFDHYHSALKDSSGISNALNLDIKVLQVENGVAHKSSLSLDNADVKLTAGFNHDKDNRKDVIPQDTASKTETENTEPVPPSTPSSFNSITTLASMQSPSLDPTDCNDSLDTTLTESTPFEIHDEESNVMSQNHFQSSSQESIDSQHLCVTIEEDSESATSSTKLQRSPINSHNISSTAPHVVSVAADGSSFSSISSLSTNTDVSVSATTSSSDAETTDTPTVVAQSTLPVDEQGFVEINLDARNSFEPSRVVGNSQDNRIAEIQVSASGPVNTGAKPKPRKGFTNFLSR